MVWRWRNLIMEAILIDITIQMRPIAVLVTHCHFSRRCGDLCPIATTWQLKLLYHIWQTSCIRNTCIIQGLPASWMPRNDMGMKWGFMEDRFFVIFQSRRIEVPFIHNLIKMFRETSSCTLICLRNLIISDLFLVYAHCDHPVAQLRLSQSAAQVQYKNNIWLFVSESAQKAWKSVTSWPSPYLGDFSMFS